MLEFEEIGTLVLVGKENGAADATANSLVFPQKADIEYYTIHQLHFGV